MWEGVEDEWRISDCCRTVRGIQSGIDWWWSFSERGVKYPIEYLQLSQKCRWLSGEYCWSANPFSAKISDIHIFARLVQRLLASLQVSEHPGQQHQGHRMIRSINSNDQSITEHQWLRGKDYCRHLDADPSSFFIQPAAGSPNIVQLRAWSRVSSLKTWHNELTRGLSGRARAPKECKFSANATYTEMLCFWCERGVVFSTWSTVGK